VYNSLPLSEKPCVTIRNELAQLSRLAAPIILTQLSQMGMGVADTIMAGHVSPSDLAGVALGANLYWPVTFLCTGVLMAITPTVAHLHGARQQGSAGEVARQATWLALVFGVLLTLGFHQAAVVYEALGVDPEAIPVALAYLEAISWGVVPLLGYSILRYLCEGMSWTIPAMSIAFAGLVLKVPLNYLFINGFDAGWLKLPALGGPGCGWASALIMWIELAAMMIVVAGSRMRVTGIFSRWSWPSAGAIFRLIKLGVPIGLTGFLEFGMFSVVALLVGRFGVESVAAHQIAMNLGGITFMVPMAVGIAASIRIGFHVGGRQLPAARRSTVVAVTSVAIYACLGGLLVLLFRSGIAALYTSDEAVLVLAVELMLFVAIWQLVDATQAAAIGALRGFKDTRMPMLIALLAYWGVGMPVGTALGFGWVAIDGFTGLRGFWVGYCVALLFAAVVLLSRLAWLTRRDERVLAFSSR
jgi:MATE family multidrug resistance protein